ncbi:hypothetical protein MTO96_032610 [Rhipicephalus appendiculatus]
MSASDEFRLPKLSSDNYHTWSIGTRAALVQKGCWEAIDPGFSVGTINEREKAIDNKALTFLFLVVEDNYLDDIGTCRTARDAWNTLQDMHSKFGLLHILQLMRDFFNVKMKRDESMQDYLGRLMDLHRKLSNAGYAFIDREVALVMLMGLPETYEQLILKLEQDEETLTTRTVKTRLVIEEKRKLRRSKECSSDEERRTRALISKARSKIESMQHNEKVHRATVKKDEKKNRQCTSSTQKKVRCFACGKIAHIAKDCDQFSDEGDDRPKRNPPQARIATQLVLCAKNLATAHPYVWNLDSGATDHMTSHRTKFRDFKLLLQNFDKYRRMVENIHHTKVKTLRSDNGGEYTGKEFNMYLVNHGIKHQLTIPGTPEQNGVTE